MYYSCNYFKIKKKLLFNFSQVRGDDLDDAFEDSACIKVSAGKVQARERSEAIKEHLRKEKMLESCHWCFESRRMLKHLIIAIGIKVRSKF